MYKKGDYAQILRSNGDWITVYVDEVFPNEDLRVKTEKGTYTYNYETKLTRAEVRTRLRKSQYIFGKGIENYSKFKNGWTLH